MDGRTVGPSFVRVDVKTIYPKTGERSIINDFRSSLKMADRRQRNLAILTIQLAIGYDEQGKCKITVMVTLFLIFQILFSVYPTEKMLQLYLNSSPSIIAYNFLLLT